MAKKPAYGNDSISALKGADRVRRRPAVIFGSDGLEGCEHSIFEILSNSIDEAREGYGKKIIVTRYADHSVEIEDFGRGIPVDFNQREQRYFAKSCPVKKGSSRSRNTLFPSLFCASVLFGFSGAIRRFSHGRAMRLKPGILRTIKPWMFLFLPGTKERRRP